MINLIMNIDITKTPEIVLEVLGEGGGLYISRNIHNEVSRFIINHQECDVSDEGLDANKQLAYSSFDEASTYIDQK